MMEQSDQLIELRPRLYSYVLKKQRQLIKLPTTIILYIVNCQHEENQLQLKYIYTS